MTFPVFIIYFIINCAFLVWGFINEDKLIAFEQRIIAAVKRKLKARKEHD